MTDGNDIAYPEIYTTQHASGFSETYSQGGLTKREYFAAMAMASGKSAKEAVIESDELIKTLNGE